MRRVAAMIALVGGAAGWALADPVRIERPLERMDAARVVCLQGRAASAAARGLSGPTACFVLTSEQSGAVTELQASFCSDPAQFCTRYREMPADQRLSTFVNADCQPAAQEGSLTGAATISPDSRFAAEVRASWGCRGGAVEESTPGSRLRLRQSWTCDSARMPFACASGSSEMTALGTDVAPGGAGECVIRVSAEGDPGGRAAIREELLLRSSRSFYAGASAGDQRADALQSVAALAAPDRLADLSRQFEVARRAMIRTLETSGAPASTVARIQALKVFPLGKLNERPADPALLTRFMNSCGAGPVGDTNASALKETGEVVVCPALLLAAETSGPAAILPTLLHEMSHFAGPCETGLGLSRKADPTTCALPAAEEASPEMGYLRRLDGLTGCLSTSAGGSAIGPGPHATVASVAERIRGLVPPGTAGREEWMGDWRCQVEQMRPSGGRPALLASCNYHFGDFTRRSSERLSRLSRASFEDEAESTPSFDWGSPAGEALTRDINSINAAGFGKAEEAAADHLAGSSLALAMADPEYRSPRPALAELGGSERAAEVMTSVAPFCEIDAHPADSHPGPAVRTALFASASGLRTLAGCTGSPSGAGAGCALPERVLMAEVHNACTSPLTRPLVEPQVHVLWPPVNSIEGLAACPQQRRWREPGSVRGGELLEPPHCRREADAVEVVERAAAEGREAHAQDRADIAVARAGDGALFQAPGGLVDHHEGQAIAAIGSAEVFMAKTDEGETTSSTSRRTSRLSSRFSRTASITRSAPPIAAESVTQRRRPRCSSRSAAASEPERVRLSS